MTRAKTTHKTKHGPEALPHGTLLSYSLGFGFSIILTLAAFGVVASASHTFAIIAIIFLTLAQLFVQLFFFLHLGRKGAPQAHQYLFGFTLLIVAIIIGGTLWIMTNLEHLHMQNMPGTMNELYINGIVAPQNELK